MIKVGRKLVDRFCLTIRTSNQDRQFLSKNTTNFSLFDQHKNTWFFVYLCDFIRNILKLSEVFFPEQAIFKGKLISKELCKVMIIKHIQNCQNTFFVYFLSKSWPSHKIGDHFFGSQFGRSYSSRRRSWPSHSVFEKNSTF